MTRPVQEIVLWGTADDKTVLEAIDHLRRYGDPKKITLVIQSHRMDRFKDKIDSVIRVHKDQIGRAGIVCWWRLFWTKTDLHVIPCKDDYNYYFGVNAVIEGISFFKSNTSIGLLKEGVLIRIPVESQIRRPYYAAVSATLALSFVGSREVFVFLAGIIIFVVFLKLLDRLYELYLKKFRPIFYHCHLFFKRKELPHVSQGWMHVYHESFFSRMVFSLEGPIHCSYDIGSNFFPVYNPEAGRSRLCENFGFMNTHRKPLDKPERSIFITGGSVAQGMLSGGTGSDDNSYNVKLENKFKRSGSDLFVIPWALGGYQSTQERIVAACSLVERKPLMILSLDFWNDALFMALGIPPGDTQRSQKKYLSEIFPGFRMIEWLSDHFVTVRAVWQEHYSRMVQDYMVDLVSNEKKFEAAVHNCVSIYVGNILWTHRLCAALGVPYIPFIQPFRDDENSPHQRDKVTHNPKMIIINRCYRVLELFIAQSEEASRLFAPKPLFDFEDFADEVHFSVKGQERIAEYIFQEINSRMMLASLPGQGRIEALQ